MANNPLWFFLLMVTAMLAWSGSWITGKWASSYPPEATSLWRFLLTAISFVPFLFAKSEKPKFEPKTWFWLLLSAATLAVYNVLFLAGLQTGGAGYGGVLVPTLNPLLSFLLAFLFLKQRATKIQTLGLAVGIAGGVLQILGDNLDWRAFLLPANIFFVSSALIYAMLTHFSAVAQKKISVYSYSFWLYLLAFVILLPWAGPVSWGNFSTFHLDFWVDVGYLALVAGTYGTTIYFVAAKKLGASKASSFAFLVPGFALALAWIFLGEPIHWSTVVGGALSVLAVLLIQNPTRETGATPGSRKREQAE